MTIRIIVELELVNIANRDTKVLGQIRFKVLPQGFAIQKTCEFIRPASLIEFFIARSEMHAGLSKSQDQITPEKDDDQTDQVK